MAKGVQRKRANTSVVTVVEADELIDELAVLLIVVLILPLAVED